MAEYAVVNKTQLDADMTSVADTIRTKGGTTEQLAWPDGYNAAIEAIQTGGGAPVEVEEKDVNFYDYDGTLLYSYTLAEAQALTELPPGPEHEGLVFQEWNWSLEGVKSLDHIADIGPFFVTDDGKTRLYLHNDTGETVNADLWWQQSVSDGIEIYCDGVFGPETFSGTGAKIKNINVPPGYSTIVFSVISGGFCPGEGRNAGYAVLDGSAKARQLLIKAEFGKNIQGSRSSIFSNQRRMKTLSIPNGIDLGNRMFDTCASLEFFVGKSLDVEYQYTFVNNFALKAISFGEYASNDSTTTSYNGMQNCYGLTRMSLPHGVKKTSRATWDYCGRLRRVYLPSTLTEISNYPFRYNYSMVELICGGPVAVISANSFLSNGSMRLYDFTKCTAVPTLENVNAFSGIPSDCEIRVPAALYDEWIAATNWSTYTANIVGVQV